jgi:hypothetical protein
MIIPTMQISIKQMANVPPAIPAFSIIIIRDRAANLEKDIFVCMKFKCKMRVEIDFQILTKI